MTKNSQYIENAKAHLDQLGEELSELESKVSKAGKEADEWSVKQAGKLKKDWEAATSEMKSLADKIEAEGEASIEKAKERADSHWHALKAAVKTYRSHVEKSVAN